MFDIHHKKEIVVKDFTSYPSEFPFKDPSCLTRLGYSVVEMHQEDLADEARITDELNAPAVTHSQSTQVTLKQTLIQSNKNQKTRAETLLVLPIGKMVKSLQHHQDILLIPRDW